MSRLLIRTTFACVALLILASGIRAQTPQDTNFRRFSIGPYFMPGAGVFAGDVPNAWKTDLKFNWSAGLLTQFATSPRFAMTLGLAYDNRNFFFKEDSNSSATTQYKFSTFDIHVGAKFSDFMLGVGFGFPMSAHADLTDANGKEAEAPATLFSDADLKMKVELRIGAAFSIVESEVGKLQFMVFGGYSFTNAFASEYPMLRLDNGGTSIDVQDTPSSSGESRSIKRSQHATLQLGFSYLFNLGGKY